MQALDVADFEIERRLDTFARARLSPEARAMARVRARVIREARLAFQAARIAAQLDAAARHRRRSPVRQLAMPLLAAAVWLAIAAGTISAAQAGGPLYPARMWLEDATLPAAGSARASAELDRLDARVAEAMAAAARGDAGAVQAALVAYRQIADQALAASVGDDALESVIATALGRHTVVLRAVAGGLAERGNVTAAEAVEASLQRAIEQNQAVIERLVNTGAGSGGGSGGGAGAAQPGAGGGEGSGGGAGAGAGTGKPGVTARPTPNPAGPPDASPRGAKP